MTELKNKILVYGSDHETHHAIVEKIVKYRVIWRPSHLPYFRSTTHTLNTKYYTTTVEFWSPLNDAIPSGEEAFMLSNNIGQEHLSELSVVDALLLVCSHNTGKLVEELEWLEQFINFVKPSILLFFVLSEKNFEWLEKWSMEHGVEVITIKEDDIICREKHGYSRLLEAIEANLWDGMNRKEPEILYNSKETVVLPGLSDASDSILAPEDTFDARLNKSLLKKENEFLKCVTLALQAKKAQGDNSLSGKQRKSMASQAVLMLSSALNIEGSNSDSEIPNTECTEILDDSLFF